MKRYTSLDHSQTYSPSVTSLQSNSVLYSSPLNAANIPRLSSSSQPMVGVIDTGFGTGEHGTQVADAITQVDHQAPNWLGSGVGKGNWAQSLVQFVNQSKATGNNHAVANLSFDLTQVNPDGTVSTRQQLTNSEQQALRYAQDNGVLIVAAAGNQNSEMSALGQASQQFDNIITVGASDGSQRASYSNYGKGLDLLAPGKMNGSDLTGTSLSAAEVTGTAAKVWSANSQLSDRQVIQVLKSSAQDVNQPGWDAQTGSGLLNQTEAVQLAEQTQPEPPQLKTYRFSGSRLVEQPTWQSTNGAIASERPDRMISEDGHQIAIISNGNSNVFKDGKLISSQPVPKPPSSNNSGSNTPTPSSTSSSGTATPNPTPAPSPAPAKSPSKPNSPPASSQPSQPINGGPPQYTSPGFDRRLAATPVPAPKPAPKPAQPQSSGNFFGDLWNNATHVAGDVHNFMNQENVKNVTSWVHDGLSVVGLIPGVNVVADGLNTALYLAEGDYGNAAISGVSMIPGLGEIGAGARLTSRVFGEGSKIVKVSTTADDILKGVGKVQKVVNRPMAMYGFASGVDDTLTSIQKGDWQNVGHGTINTLVSGVGLFHSLKAPSDSPKTPQPKPETDTHPQKPATVISSSKDGDPLANSAKPGQPKPDASAGGDRPHPVGAGKPQDVRLLSSTSHPGSSPVGSKPPTDNGGGNPGSGSRKLPTSPSKDLHGSTSSLHPSDGSSPTAPVTPKNPLSSTGIAPSDQANGSNPHNQSSNDHPASTNNLRPTNGNNHDNNPFATSPTPTRVLNDVNQPSSQRNNATHDQNGSYPDSPGATQPRTTKPLSDTNPSDANSSHSSDQNGNVNPVHQDPSGQRNQQTGGSGGQPPDEPPNPPTASTPPEPEPPGGQGGGEPPRNNNGGNDRGNDLPNPYPLEQPADMSLLKQSALGEKGMRIEPSPSSPEERRNQLGVATGGENLPEITGTWFSAGTNGLPAGHAAPFPLQIAERMRAMPFKNFREFRETFWKFVAQDPVLQDGWTPGNLGRMKHGLAPIAPVGQLGGERTYQLNHQLPVGNGGGVYDMDNIEILSPEFHDLLGDAQ